MVENLILDGQQILTIPPSLYTLESGSVTFSDIVQTVYEDITGTCSKTENTEEDWALLIQEDFFHLQPRVFHVTVDSRKIPQLCKKRDVIFNMRLKARIITVQ